MSNPSRRVAVPNQQYYAVPQSPQGQSRHPSQPMPAPQASTSQGPRSDTAYGVATGAIGGGYGPYSYNPTISNGNNTRYNGSRFSAAPSETSVGTGGERTVNTTTQMIGTASVQPYPYLWDARDPDLDDPLHNPDPVRDAALDRTCTPFSARGWMNASALVLIVLALLTLFAGYPIITYYVDTVPSTPGYNLGGINGSGQIPYLPGMPSLIDKDTPTSAYSYKATDGTSYNLVFSDEFEQDGRTFWPGDDPFWEAVDMHYWPTGDLEWYSPKAITTQDGKLVITITEQEINNLNFQSGMLQSWNKLCFTTGYLEVSVSMPGSPRGPGFWPAVWTMGNLGRAGYGATTEGTWPYSYGACDVGTLENQTYTNGTPSAADGLSMQPGQRVSACTCPGGDHPGPSVNVGRGVPEIDIFETQVNTAADFQGEVSQSMQVAPYDNNYKFDDSQSVAPIQNTAITAYNTYFGGPYQQAVSAVTDIPSTVYNNTGYGTYGIEYVSDPSDSSSGYVTWFSNGVQSWKVTAAAIGPDATTEISQRLISLEPMAININLGLSPSFQEQDWEHLQFPSSMYIDYIRIYQPEGLENALTCDPPNFPTANYIANHLNAYSNVNLTTWAQAGYTFPKNSLVDQC